MCRRERRAPRLAGPTGSSTAESAARPAAGLLLLVAVGSVQFGSAFADKIFPTVGPGGVALLRVLFTAAVLLVVARPSLRGRTRRELATVAGYGLALAGMNWSFYEALHRLPLGVAVTIEFTGPLAVAVAGSRRLVDGLWVLLAAAGVGLLALRGGHAGVHAAGVLLALVAASCWALYILLAKRIGTSFGALEALAIGMVVGTLLVAPAGDRRGRQRAAATPACSPRASGWRCCRRWSRTPWSWWRCAGCRPRCSGC